MTPDLRKIAELIKQVGEEGVEESDRTSIDLGLYDAKAAHPTDDPSLAPDAEPLLDASDKRVRDAQHRSEARQEARDVKAAKASEDADGDPKLPEGPPKEIKPGVYNKPLATNDEASQVNDILASLDATIDWSKVTQQTDDTQVDAFDETQDFSDGWTLSKIPENRLRRPSRLGKDLTTSDQLGSSRRRISRDDLSSLLGDFESLAAGAGAAAAASSAGAPETSAEQEAETADQPVDTPVQQTDEELEFDAAADSLDIDLGDGDLDDLGDLTQDAIDEHDEETPAQAAASAETDADDSDFDLDALTDDSSEEGSLELDDLDLADDDLEPEASAPDSVEDLSSDDEGPLPELDDTPEPIDDRIDIDAPFSEPGLSLDDNDDSTEDDSPVLQTSEDDSPILQDDSDDSPILQTDDDTQDDLADFDLGDDDAPLDFDDDAATEESPLAASAEEPPAPGLSTDDSDEQLDSLMGGDEDFDDLFSEEESSSPVVENRTADADATEVERSADSEASHDLDDLFEDGEGEDTLDFSDEATSETEPDAAPILAEAEPEPPARPSVDESPGFAVPGAATATTDREPASGPPPRSSDEAENQEISRKVARLPQPFQRALGPMELEDLRPVFVGRDPSLVEVRDFIEQKTGEKLELASEREQRQIPRVAIFSVAAMVLLALGFVLFLFLRESPPNEALREQLWNVANAAPGTVEVSAPELITVLQSVPEEEIEQTLDVLIRLGETEATLEVLENEEIRDRLGGVKHAQWESRAYRKQGLMAAEQGDLAGMRANWSLAVEGALSPRIDDLETTGVIRQSFLGTDDRLNDLHTMLLERVNANIDLARHWRARGCFVETGAALDLAKADLDQLLEEGESEVYFYRNLSIATLEPDATVEDVESVRTFVDSADPDGNAFDPEAVTDYARFMYEEAQKLNETDEFERREALKSLTARTLNTVLERYPDYLRARLLAGLHYQDRQSIQRALLLNQPNPYLMDNPGLTEGRPSERQLAQWEIAWAMTGVADSFFQDAEAIYGDLYRDFIALEVSLEEGWQASSIQEMQRLYDEARKHFSLAIASDRYYPESYLGLANLEYQILSRPLPDPDLSRDVEEVRGQREHVRAVIRSFTRASALAEQRNRDLSLATWQKAAYRHARLGTLYMLSFATPPADVSGGLATMEDLQIAQEIASRLIDDPVHGLRASHQTAPTVNILSGLLHAWRGSLQIQLQQEAAPGLQTDGGLLPRSIEQAILNLRKAERYFTVAVERNLTRRADMLGARRRRSETLDGRSEGRAAEQIRMSRELAIALNNRGVVRFYLGRIELIMRAQGFGNLQMSQAMAAAIRDGEALIAQASEDFLAASRVQTDMNLVAFKNLDLTEEGSEGLVRPPTALQLTIRDLTQSADPTGASGSDLLEVPTPEQAPALIGRTTSLSFLNLIPAELDGSRTHY